MADAYDLKWEKKLNISTAPADYEKDDAYHSRYEPTPYAVLQRLAESGRIGPENTLLDYGCGKGRVSLFMNHATGCRSVGVDYNPPLVEAARKNLAACSARRCAQRVSFLCAQAEMCEIGNADCFYFFNPFSANILQGVLGRIFESWYQNPRTLRLFVYYALDNWLDVLMNDERLHPDGEIDCRDLFANGDPREKILIFSTDSGF